MEGGERRRVLHVLLLSLLTLLRFWEDAKGFIFCGGGGFTPTLEIVTYFFPKFFWYIVSLQPKLVEKTLIIYGVFFF